MNIQLVKVGPKDPYGLFICYKCRTVIHSGVDRVYADLDGEPFKTYYHEVCIPRAQQTAAPDTTQGATS